MPDTMCSSLRAAAALTFEQLGFLFAEDEPEDEALDLPLRAAARVRFRGPRTGTVEVGLTAEVLDELAANMLALDTPVSPHLQEDALGEVANVVCGNVLPSLLGPEAVFDLTSPSVTAHPAPLEDAGPGACHVTVGLDMGRAEVTLRVDENGDDRGEAP
jgi:hypothetical protein